MKPRILVLTHVPPLPRTSGQRQRVFHTLRALRDRFHVTLACLGGGEELRTECDELIRVPSLYRRSRLSRVVHRVRAGAWGLRRGVRPSNYVLGRLEFAPERLERLLGERRFDCVLLEYWHASDAAEWFRARGTATVLDMHDVLWRVQEKRWSWAPAPLRRWAVGRYRRAEEAAWRRFDAVVAITPGEFRHVRRQLPADARVFCTPMGIDLDAWAYGPDPAEPVRFAFYGGLSSAHNREAALRVHRSIMPRVWAKAPDAELWLVGARPAPALRALAQDPRVRITGYVEEVAEILRTMHALFCPWSGRYGFRSRLIEVMALGVPVIVNSDAIHGMGLDPARGVLVAERDEQLAELALRCVTDPEWRRAQGRAARAQVEEGLSLAGTYGRLATDLGDWVEARA